MSETYNFQGTAYTQTSLQDHSIKELLELYNAIAEGLKKSVLKSFKDKTTAMRRCWEILGVYSAQPSPAKTQQSADTKVKGKRNAVLNGTIKIITTENPKRRNTRAYEKFAVLMSMDGKTVKDFKAEEGKHENIDQYEVGWPRTELRWAVNAGMVKVIPSTTE